MLTAAGPVRSGAALAALAERLGKLRASLGPPPLDARAVELRHAVAAASLIVQAAARRTESRGGHWREDHPAADPAWAGIHLEQLGLPPLPD
jgi:L-aspartate oxidase